MTGFAPSNVDISGGFKRAVGSVGKARRPSKATKPFSIRLTPAERATLEERAGRLPLGQYIRDVLLGEGVTKRRAARKPQLDDQKVAALLSGLGQSRLSSNLNQLAKSANMGTLDVDEDIKLQLQQACVAILAMREALMIALRINARG
jgi:hypothetical protein